MSDPAVCEFGCKEPVVGSRVVQNIDGEGRVVDVCESCADDLDRAAKRAKAADIEECRGDYERDSRKMEFDR